MLRRPVTSGAEHRPRLFSIKDYGDCSEGRTFAHTGRGEKDDEQPKERPEEPLGCRGGVCLAHVEGTPITDRTMTIETICVTLAPPTLSEIQPPTGRIKSPMSGPEFTTKAVRKWLARSSIC